jgi:hypothetical protein
MEEEMGPGKDVLQVRRRKWGEGKNVPREEIEPRRGCGLKKNCSLRSRCVIGKMRPGKKRPGEKGGPREGVGLRRRHSLRRNVSSRTEEMGSRKRHSLGKRWVDGREGAEEVKSSRMDSGRRWWAQGQFPKRRWGQGEGGAGGWFPGTRWAGEKMSPRMI